MGFGSYDESEQEDGEAGTIDDDETVTTHEHEHDGDVSIEGADDSEALVDRLQDIKESES